MDILPCFETTFWLFSINGQFKAATVDCMVHSTWAFKEQLPELVCFMLVHVIAGLPCRRTGSSMEVELGLNARARQGLCHMSELSGCLLNERAPGRCSILTMCFLCQTFSRVMGTRVCCSSHHCVARPRQRRKTKTERRSSLSGPHDCCRAGI